MQYAVTRKYDNPSEWYEIVKFVSDYKPQRLVIGVRSWLNTSIRWMIEMNEKRRRFIWNTFNDHKMRLIDRRNNLG